MKTIQVLGVTLIAVSMTLATSALAGSESQIGIGKRVAAMWNNSGYFLGTVTGIEGTRFDILFEDGDRQGVEAAQVVALREDTPFAIGDHVMAAWKGIAMYPGVITKVHAKSCMVKWDDGDEPLLVAKDKIFHADRAVAAGGIRVGDRVTVPWGNSQTRQGVVVKFERDLCLIQFEAGVFGWSEKSLVTRSGEASSKTFNVGDHVAAMWRDSRYYPGVVEEVRGSQCLIKWDDGDEPLFVINEHIRALTQTSSASLSVGDHVMATWKNSQMYPGVVDEVRGDMYLIRWDDGDEPMLVPKDKIRPIAAHSRGPTPQR